MIRRTQQALDEQTDERDSLSSEIRSLERMGRRLVNPEAVRFANEKE